MDREMELLLRNVVTANHFAGRHELNNTTLLEILKLQARMIEDLQQRIEILEEVNHDH